MTCINCGNFLPEDQYCANCDDEPRDEEQGERYAISQARDVGYKSPHRVIINDADFPVALVYGTSDQAAQEQARIIVRAVNSHDALVGALRDCVKSLERLPDVDGAYRVTCLSQAQKALALATNDD